MCREQGSVKRVRVVRRAGNRAGGIDGRIVWVSLRIRLRRSGGNAKCRRSSGIAAIAKVGTVIDATAALAGSAEVNRILHWSAGKLNGRAIAAVAGDGHLRRAVTAAGERPIGVLPHVECHDEV